MITINGVEYEEIPKYQPNIKSKHVASVVALASLFGGVNMFGGQRSERSLPAGTDVVKEFELIQLKKSKLSRNHRDMVERIFNDTYRPVKK